MKKRVSLLVAVVLLAISVIACELTACDLLGPGEEPGPGPAPRGDCDPATTAIEADRSYSESMHTTTESYPANCLYYCVWIPEGKDSLTVGIYDFNVDLDLYVGYGELSTVTGSEVTEGETYTWKSNEFGTEDEEVGIRNPDGGEYYIEVCSYEGEGSPFRLQATVR